jgi:hypothetical protein
LVGFSTPPIVGAEYAHACQASIDLFAYYARLWLKRP